MRCCAGSATAPATSLCGAVPCRPQSATCTAQSARPSSANSRVPSSGSTIQTRSAVSRSTSSRPPGTASSSDSTASAGRQRASSVAEQLVRQLVAGGLAGRPGRRSPARRAVRSSSSPARPASQRGEGAVDDRRSQCHQYAPELRAQTAVEGAQQDHQVQRERPVLHVAQVQPDRLLPRQVGPAGHLPQPGHAGLDREPAAHVVGVRRDLLRQRRPRPDQRHLPAAAR